jgi:hypothetical protein
VDWNVDGEGGWEAVMDVDQIEGFVLAWAIIISVWVVSVLALVAYILRRLFNVPVALTVGTPMLIGPALWWIPWTHKEYGCVFLAATVIGALLVGRSIHLIVRSRRDAAEEPRMHRQQLTRSARYRVAAAVAALVGVLFPLSAPIAWVLGTGLWVAAFGVERRKELGTHSTPIDRSLARELGRYVDGRWVCFEHQKRWCPICSARIGQHGDSTDAPGARGSADGDVCRPPEPAER